MTIIRKFNRDMKVDIERFIADLPPLPDKPVIIDKPKAKKQNEWNLKEVNLSGAVFDYFTKQGYCAVSEYRSHDWAFFKENEIIIVEMKKTFSKKLVYQCRNVYFADKVFAVIGTNPTQKSINALKKAVELEGQSIGLISVINNEVEIIIPAEPRRESYYKQFYLERLFLYHKEHGNSTRDSGGKPNMKGEGVAQAVLSEIKEYVKQNPECTWRQIYHKVPNHYASWKSLQGSMRSWQGFDLDKYKSELRGEI